ncbi:hypothetical protein LAJ19_21520 (plasmid) [Deinococcus taeanensis]|uniref:lipase family protein n=1 Tax=Deinococcus taeanensis TaxID=2737050 RepID=UPI001CDC6C30|nr:lipase family protein [Deinococcus taeanensis]UBV45506.1 hypothetical protein LAJ19_21520 [Deinococcus taeanensis]
MPEALRSRPPSAATPTKASAAPATPVKAPASTWPPVVLAELQRNALQIRNRYGKPDQIAAYLHDWIRRHTQEQLMEKTVKANLGPLGDVIPDWAEGVSTSAANGVLGASAAQDLTTGSTRHLTQTRHDADRAGLTNITGAYQARNVLNGSANMALLRGLLSAITPGDRPGVAAAYARLNGGKTLSAALGELIRDPNARAPLMALLAPPISEAVLAHDAFLEQLAVGLVYSNQPARDMNADTLDERRHSNPAALLAHYGFKAGPLVSGRWGFQMRVFTPIPGKAKWPQPIVAFRGTEGVQFDVKGDAAAKKAQAAGKTGPEVAAARQLGREGTVDSVIGDASPTQIGWLQVQPNLQLIEANLARLKGKAVSTGHSLGGGIAQLVTALKPQFFASVVTFQAPGIDANEVKRLRRYNAGAGKSAPVTARHYRVDGDIVPTAGQQMLDGDIAYFDRTSRPAGTTTPFSTNVAENVTAGHVTPMLSTYIRGLKPVHPDLQVIVNQGLRDEATLQSGKDKRDVQMTFSGAYATAQDPRINTEASRKKLTGNVDLIPGQDPFEAVVYANIAYNTLLSHVENVAADQRVKTLAEFRQRCDAIFQSGRPLPLDPDDVSLARILNLDHFEKDYDARPMATGVGLPVYPMKSMPIVTFLKDGVKIPPEVLTQVRARLPEIWLAWRGQ